MSYEMGNFTNATNIATQFIAVNTASDGVIAALALLTVWVIFTMILLRVSEPAEALAGSSAVSMIFGFMLWGLGALNSTYVWATVLILAFSLTALSIKSR